MHDDTSLDGKNQRQSGDIRRRIRAATELDPMSRLLLEAVMERGGGGRWACTASAATLGQELGLCARQVKRKLKALEDGGWTHTERGGGKLKSPFRKIYLGARISTNAPLRPIPAMSIGWIDQQ